MKRGTLILGLSSVLIVTPNFSQNVYANEEEIKIENIQSSKIVETEATENNKNENINSPYKGNGNDGCQIEDIPGHKDHGQSNEHKIDTMTKAE